MRYVLSTASARRIVDEIGTVMQRDLLIALPDGKILAASRPELNDRTLDIRTGEILEDETGQRPPVWGGSLLPVLGDGDVVCVLGITGEGDDAQQAGRILRTMTSILFQEDRTLETERSSRSVTERFLEDWLLVSLPVDHTALELRARQLGLDINRTRTAGALLIRESENGEDEPDGAESNHPLVEQVLTLLPRLNSGENRAPLVVAMGSRVIFLFETDSSTTARQQLQEIQTAVEEAIPVHLYGGTGQPRKSFSTIRESVAEAERAARSALLSAHREVLAFDDIALALFLQDMPVRTGREFIHRVFRKIPDAEREAALRLLTVYFEQDGSLMQTARVLGIHKNTLQYRLRRLEERTGMDPRKLRDAMSLYLATLIQEFHYHTTKPSSGGTS